MKNQGLIALLLLIGLASACHDTNEPVSTAPAPAMTPVASPSMVALPARTVSNTSTMENKDGSTTVVTTYSDGTKSEVRTFKTGRLSRVTRATNAAGQRTARVTYRDTDREVELRDESWVDKSMDATGAALVEVADKAEDVGDATKKGVKKIGDKAEDVGSAVKKGVKKGVNEVGDKAEDVGDAMKKGAKKVTKKTKEIVH
jgi:hypothetical protein